MALLKVQSVSKSYKALKVLNDINLEVDAGERHVIIGPNGAGKTTLIHAITGVIPISEGRVFIDGADVTDMPSYTRVSFGMARTFQKNNLFEKLSVEENVHLAITACKSYKNGLLKSLSAYHDLLKETNELLMEWNLWDRRKKAINELSYGEQRLIEIILAIASKPRILLLDEPTSGMSPMETAQTTKLIQNLPRTISLLVIEHDMEVVFSIADRITVLHHGEVLLTGSPQEIRGNELVKEIYFGGGAVAHA